MECKHGRFVSTLSCTYLEDIRRFMADITIKCEECGTPFRFLGLGVGLDINGAMTSPDGTEGRFAITPRDLEPPPLQGTTGFTIKRRTAGG